MKATAKAFAGKGRFAHGVHPPERKQFAAEAAIEVVTPPERVALPLLQSAGAPSDPVVKTKQQVQWGDMVAKAGGFISAPVHTPLSGKVLKSTAITLPNGRHMRAIPIQAEGEQLSGKALWDEIYGGEWPREDVERYSPEQIVEAIRDAGIVGLGGAGFPTFVKLMPNPQKPVDTLLINGCECEPYLTADYRLMLEAPEAILAGALLAARASGAKEIVFGIEDNKPKALQTLRAAASGTGIKIAVLPTKYPQGSEKQLIMAVLGRAVPLGGLPLDVGVVVSNVGTLTAIARAVMRGKPLTHRVLSVTGAGITQPKNLLVPIGISFGELVDLCGGLTPDAARLVAGGPMMGFAFNNLATPVTKGTSGLTVLTHSDLRKAEETSCIRCGRCVDVCPMNLVPTRLGLGSRNKNVSILEKYNIMACFECGCCAYICPAKIPLVQLMRVGKTLYLASKK